MLRLSSQTVTQPTATVATGGLDIRVTNDTTQLSIALATTDYPPVVIAPAGTAMAALRGGDYVYIVAGLPPATYQAIITDTPTGLTLSAVFQILAPPTADTTPPALTAAHLPALAVLRAAPSGSPLAPAALLLIVEVSRAGGWQEVGRLREVCDATTGTARFDLSEYLKTQFAKSDPLEGGGIDPALSIPYQARYGRADSFTGIVGTEAGTFAALAVNAAVQLNPSGAVLPLPIGPTAPYASVPAGYARFRSTVNAAGTGITNVDTTPEVAADWPCAVRQFVWLDPAGAWAWGFFSGRHEHGTEAGEPTVLRQAGGVERYADAGDTRDTLRVHSDVLDWPTYQVLRGVRRSPQVYERLPTGAYVPVLVERGSFNEYKETDKVFAMDFTVRYPLQTIQTQ